MRFVLTSDIEGNIKICEKAVELANKENADIIVAGDLMNWDLKNVRANFRKIIRTLAKCKKNVYVIPGSHEDARNYMLVTYHKEKKWSNIIDINRRIIETRTHYFIGYGGSSSVIDKVFLKHAHYGIHPEEDELMLDQLLSIKGKPVIFVSHIPPYSYLDTAVFKKVKVKKRGQYVAGISPAVKGEKGAIEEHVGSKVLQRVVEKHKPLLHVFGHIHESSGYEELKTHKVKKKSKHMLVNVGPGRIVLVEVKKNVRILSNVSL